MTQSILTPESKLPALGTTIFTQMSALAQQHNAINLSQGFPDLMVRATCRTGWLIMSVRVPISMPL